MGGMCGREKRNNETTNVAIEVHASDKFGAFVV
jgi:hypothetical protein